MAYLFFHRELDEQIFHLLEPVNYYHQINANSLHQKIKSAELLNTQKPKQKQSIVELKSDANNPFFVLYGSNGYNPRMQSL